MAPKRRINGTKRSAAQSEAPPAAVVAADHGRGRGKRGGTKVRERQSRAAQKQSTSTTADVRACLRRTAARPTDTSDNTSPYRPVRLTDTFDDLTDSNSPFATTKTAQSPGSKAKALIEAATGSVTHDAHTADRGRSRTPPQARAGSGVAARSTEPAGSHAEAAQAAQPQAQAAQPHAEACRQPAAFSPASLMIPSSWGESPLPARTVQVAPVAVSRAASPFAPAANKSKPDVVESLDQAMECFDYYLDKVLEEDLGEHWSECPPSEIDAVLQSLYNSITSETVSSSCTGIETNYAARSEFIQKITSRMSSVVEYKQPTYLWFCEKNKFCIAELDLLFPKEEYPDLCIFPQMLDFLCSQIMEIRSVLAAMDGDDAWNAVVPIIKRGLGCVHPLECKCLRHPEKKACKVRCSDHHHSSNPCTDFSSLNHARPRMAGKNMLVAASFCAQRCTIQEERFSYENVPGLMQFLAQALGHLYHLDCAAASPEGFGHAVTRPREFVDGRHRVKALASVPPLAQFLRRFHRVCNWSCMSYFWAHEFAELEDYITEDMRWAYNRPTAAWRTDGLGPVTFGKQAKTEDYWRCLNGMEQKHWGYLRDAGIAPEQIGQLKDNYKRIKGMHSNPSTGYLHALIRSCGILYSENTCLPAGRWMTGLEAAVVQGFRVQPKYFKGPFAMKPVCALNLERDDRKGQHTREMMGNALPVPIAGLVLLHQWRTKRPIDLHEQISSSENATNVFLSMILGNKPHVD